MGCVLMDTSNGSVVMVLRSGDGHYMGSSAMVFKGLSYSPTLEGLAVFLGGSSLVSRSFSLQRVTVASDCKQMLMDIAEGTGCQLTIVQFVNLV
jgi:hypothetical protein